jgi:hypothetical protein
LIIDEAVAPIVREIFRMFLEGKSKNSIANTLINQGIESPAVYKREIQKLNFKMPQLKPLIKPLWSGPSIHRILSCQMYCGDMVQGQYRIKSYKIHVTERVPKEEWFVAYNTHEPIISRSDFEKTQSLLQRDTRAAPRQKHLYLFGGFMRCADCNRAMHRLKSEKRVYYFCNSYKLYGKKVCSSHSIRHEKLEQAVLKAVQQQIYIALQCSEALAQINKAPVRKRQTLSLKDKREKKKNELARIMRYKQSIWQDWKDGELSQMDYRHMREDYDRKAEELEQSLKLLDREQEELDKGADTEEPILATFRKYENITQLTREVLIDLIDEIKVHENRSITVKFKFADRMSEICKIIADNTNSERVG